MMALVAFQMIFAQQPETSIDWDADLDYLAAELPEKHYNFFAHRSKADFLSEIEVIKKESANLNDFQMALRMQQMIARFGDTHTMIGFLAGIDNERKLPLSLYWTSDGLHVLRTTTGHEEILGCELLSINNIPVSAVIDSICTLFTIDNQGIVKGWMPQLVPSVQILEYFGVMNNADEAVIELVDKDRKRFTHTLSATLMNKDNRVSFKADSVAFCTKNQGLYFTDHYYADAQTYHILYNRCWNKERELEYGDPEKAKSIPSFVEFEEQIFAALNSQPVKKIIFDVRYNGGGDSRPGTAFIKRLAEYLTNHEEIKTYAIIGRNTFSSGILNAIDFKNFTHAMYVGEETAGKPNHFGEVRSFVLPSSNLTVDYSTKYFKNVDENVNSLLPDHTVEMSFTDYTKGIDPVAGWIMEQ